MTRNSCKSVDTVLYHTECLERGRACVLRLCGGEGYYKSDLQSCHRADTETWLKMIEFSPGCAQAKV